MKACTTEMLHYRDRVKGLIRMLRREYVFQKNADERSEPVALACALLSRCLSPFSLYSIKSAQLNGNESKW